MQTRSAASVAATAVTAAQLIGAQWNPSPTHPRTALWYASLRKPSFTPPGPVFAIAWTVLDGLQAYAGYRLLKERPSAARSAALGAWALNLLGVAGFSWVLFGRKRLGEALGVTSGMVVTAATAAGTATLVDRRAGAASLPLLAWVTFAAVLQEEVWRRNT
ncbi:MAG: tryptophan-rich sensory protein [Acetobacteraceae bacterium]|nr:tryptophan-rich sensory protein [Acetobacteraceae bacterium]